MSADDLLQWVAQALFVLIFLVTGARAFRRPLRASIDIALFFGALSVVIAEGWVVAALDATPGRALNALNSALIMALPYLLLRLVDDFADVPRWLLHAAEAGLALAVIGLVAMAPPLPAGLTLLYVAYFVGLQIYAAAMFVREARRANGLTCRRMQAAAAGSVCLSLTILAAGLQSSLPDTAGLWMLLSRFFGLAAGIGYFLGFAPPLLLRRAWQEPELRAFLSRAASLPRLPDTAATVRELERGAAASIGAPAAAIGLWDPVAAVLRFDISGEPVVQPPNAGITGRAFSTQRLVFVPDAPRADPANAAGYQARGARAVLAAPITAGAARLGVLAVYAPRAPIFAEDDLTLVHLLADQAAVVLESRALIDEAARVRAREEAARLKDDFLSAAAHDLKTPLTTIVAQAQLLERQALRDPAAPADAMGIRRMVRESQRLSDLVAELLDAARLERGQVLGPRDAADLVTLAEQACERISSKRHPCTLEAAAPVVGVWDHVRVMQVIDNLVENAVKYSPDGGEVRLKVWQGGEEAHLTVTDQGIGIPTADLPLVFERFHRGSNVDDRRFAGMGLGLFITRGIVEAHGGCIAVTSTLGGGTTFHVTLPLSTGDAHSE
jgi:signal transduction histidine kinase